MGDSVKTSRHITRRTTAYTVTSTLLIPKTPNSLLIYLQPREYLNTINMQISHLTIFAVLAGLGLAAPTTKADTRAAQEFDPLMAAGKLLPRQITSEWCTKSCDCDKVPKEE